MGAILELARARGEITLLKAKVAELGRQLTLPPPPQSLGRITANDMLLTLRPFGIVAALGSYDWELTSNEENQRFLDWYRDTHPYKLDEYDCNVYAWEMTAAALKWMNGKFPWGLIWASSDDPEYAFPSHGFCFMVNYKLEVYFCDELEMAAPRDKFEPAYPVNASLAVVN